MVAFAPWPKKGCSSSEKPPAIGWLSLHGGLFAECAGVDRGSTLTQDGLACDFPSNSLTGGAYDMSRSCSVDSPALLPRTSLWPFGERSDHLVRIGHDLADLRQRSFAARGDVSGKRRSRML